MAASPPIEVINRALRYAARKAKEYDERTQNTETVARVSRASNGEVAIVYDVIIINTGARITRLSLEETHDSF